MAIEPDWSVPEASVPFTHPFEVSAARGRLWIRPSWAEAGSEAETELHIKGVNWSGFESRFNCPENLQIHQPVEYMDYLVQHRFNAVRIPLSGANIFGSVDNRKAMFCGQYSGYTDEITGEYHRVAETTLTVLDYIIGGLRERGIFVALDVHTLTWPAHNQPFWCPAPSDGTGACKAYCRRNTNSGWANKCKYNADCAGCDECAPFGEMPVNDIGCAASTFGTDRPDINRSTTAVCNDADPNLGDAMRNGHCEGGNALSECPELRAVHDCAYGKMQDGSIAATEEPLIALWTMLAHRYCGSANVIMADLFNEPHGGHWGDPLHPSGSDWAAAATRIANAIHEICPRWLILVEGVGVGSGECMAATRTTSTGEAYCWYGENVLGQLIRPIELKVPNRLVLSPHAYGHGTQPYFGAEDFPENMPSTWDVLWGRLNDATGVPVLLGEWGGLWQDTAAWQAKMSTYLAERHVGFFYWALNDNHMTVGGLYGSADAYHYQKTANLAASPTTSITELQARWVWR